ncbi:MAG TPA: hypothetical protein VIL16_27130 [Trebonia sp.]
MNPGIAKDVAAQHHQCLRLEAAKNRRMPPRDRLGWHLSWSRTILSADAGQRRVSSLIVVISARRLRVDG